METEVTVRRWGNSLGIVLPQIFVESNNLKENEKIKVEIKKRANIKRIIWGNKKYWNFSQGARG